MINVSLTIVLVLISYGLGNLVGRRGASKHTYNQYLPDPLLADDTWIYGSPPLVSQHQLQSMPKQDCRFDVNFWKRALRSKHLWSRVVTGSELFNIYGKDAFLINGTTVGRYSKFGKLEGLINGVRIYYNG